MLENLWYVSVISKWRHNYINQHTTAKYLTKYTSDRNENTSDRKKSKRMGGKKRKGLIIYIRIFKLLWEAIRHNVCSILFMKIFEVIINVSSWDKSYNFDKEFILPEA